MARTIQTIKSDITTPFMANDVLAGIYGYQPSSSFEANFSTVSLENILFDIFALAVFLFEQMHDQHKFEVTNMLANQKAGTLPWYRTMALRFLWGFDLVTDSDIFITAGATPEQIEAARIVKYSAVNEATESSRIIIKIAGETNGILSPITEPQKESFEAYLNEVRFAGDKITVINFLPDKLFLALQIKRDPLVLNANGMSILNGNYPVNEALQEFMKELPFNGELILLHLIDKLQLVPGVIIPTLLMAESSWINPSDGGYGDPQPITISKIPESGYFEIDNYNGISYVV
ncbi:nucleotidyltransferase [Flavobacterium cerinum]|uniref:Nucleotidyltransferase n=1 Tax=Flavobacterium cerinum TaxID=2502784 RepID=A0A444HEL2_9FLAO|nr:nucleotidyltransferase [Flavobacterium cerinum]RWX03354.1 nucleotidyltransferase [Flavobacterium cerinum]